MPNETTDAFYEITDFRLSTIIIVIMPDDFLLSKPIYVYTDCNKMSVIYLVKRYLFFNMQIKLPDKGPAFYVGLLCFNYLTYINK